MPRKQSQRQRVYLMLLNAGPTGVTTAEFLRAMIPRFGGRILELRQRGHTITTERMSEGSFRYTLHTKPQMSLGGEEKG